MRPMSLGELFIIQVRINVRQTSVCRVRRLKFGLRVMSVNDKLKFVGHQACRLIRYDSSSSAILAIV